MLLHLDGFSEGGEVIAFFQPIPKVAQFPGLLAEFGHGLFGACKRLLQQFDIRAQRGNFAVENAHILFFRLFAIGRAIDQADFHDAVIEFLNPIFGNQGEYAQQQSAKHRTHQRGVKGRTHAAHRLAQSLQQQCFVMA